MLLPVPSSPVPAAVCILRVVTESWGLVITMTVNRDVTGAGTESVARFSDPGEAAAAVAAFLASFSPG